MAAISTVGMVVSLSMKRRLWRPRAIIYIIAEAEALGQQCVGLLKRSEGGGNQPAANGAMVSSVIARLSMCVVKRAQS